MNLKIIIVLLLISITTTLIFSADKSIGENAAINGNFTTTWGSDFDNESSGFSESIDINFNWDVGEWGDYSSDISDVNFNKTYGMAFVSGGLIRFKLEDDLIIDNNSGTDLLNVQILFENAWAKIVRKNFYLQLAADGMFYNREAGYNHDYSKDILRMNWAHIGSRIKQSYILNSDRYNVSGDMDTVKINGSSAGISLGADFSSYKTYISIGSPDDMYNNSDNKYDISWGNEIKPIQNMVISTTVYSGFNYNYTPLGFGSAISQDIAINSALTLQPYIGFDGVFMPEGSNDWSYLNSEFAYGLTLKWPGSNGWGYEWLYDEERGTNYGFEANYSKRYSGLTVSGNLTTIKDTLYHNLQTSLYEDTIGGLIPNIGGSILFEMKDITNELQYAYGAHIEYNFFTIFDAFARVENRDSLADESQIYLGGGLRWLDLPNTTIELRYDNEQINKIDSSKGEFRVLVNVKL